MKITIFSECLSSHINCTKWNSVFVFRVVWFNSCTSWLWWLAWATDNKMICVKSHHFRIFDFKKVKSRTLTLASKSENSFHTESVHTRFCRWILCQLERLCSVIETNIFLDIENEHQTHLQSTQLIRHIPTMRSVSYSPNKWVQNRISSSMHLSLRRQL